MSLFGQRYPVLRSVIVSTRSGESYGGVLWQRHADFLVLRNVELLTDRGRPLPTPKPITGETMIFTGNVEFLQVLPGGEL